jgi:hypothetical protein
MLWPMMNESSAAWKSQSTGKSNSVNAALLSAVARIDYLG